MRLFIKNKWLIFRISRKNNIFFWKNKSFKPCLLKNKIYLCNAIPIIAVLEVWVSGWNNQFAKLTYGFPYRGFESPRFRKRGYWFFSSLFCVWLVLFWSCGYRIKTNAGSSDGFIQRPGVRFMEIAFISVRLRPRWHQLRHPDRQSSYLQLLRNEAVLHLRLESAWRHLSLICRHSSPLLPKHRLWKPSQRILRRLG